MPFQVMLLILSVFLALHTGHTNTAHTLVVSPDSKWVASGSSDYTIALWDIANGALVQQWFPYDDDTAISLAFFPNSRFLISVSGDDPSSLVMWDLHGGLHQVIEGEIRNATRCAWSPAGDVIACGFKDASVRLWDTNTLQPLRRHAPLKHADSESGWIFLLEFSPDGRWLITGCDPTSYYIWDVASGAGRQLHAFKFVDPQVTYHVPVAAAFNPTSTRFAITSPTGRVEIQPVETGRLRVGEWGGVVLECGTGRLPRRWEMSHVSFSPDGSLVLTLPNRGPSMHAMKIWDAYTGVELFSLEGHEKPIWTACFSPCGNYVASASEDHTVRLWRTSDGSCIATLSDHDSEVRCVIFSPDGGALVSGAEDGSVIIRQMRDVLPINGRDP